MAELILTDEEKSSLWSDLDDAALGKLIKKNISVIIKASEQMDRTMLFSAALMICCGTAECNANKAEFDIEGVTQGESEFGDWKVIAMKVSKNDMQSEE